MSGASAYSRFLLAFAAAVLCGVVALSAASTLVLAQDSPASGSGDAQQPTEKSDETLKVNVNVVGVFFNVKDKHGALIPNQTKDDFEVFEDSKPQTIKYFTAESNLPLTLDAFAHGELQGDGAVTGTSAPHALPKFGGQPGGHRHCRRVPGPLDHASGGPGDESG